MTMNFIFYIISIILISGFVGTAFAQTVAIEKEFTPAEIEEMGNKAVLLTLNDGTIMIELFPEDAPNTVHNFLQLVESGYYDGIVFHRIIPGFMIQAGDPITKAENIDPENPDEHRANWGTGGPGYWIKAEFNSLQHDRGIVSMARQTNPDTAGSQFFIVHKDSNFLDGQYTAFGKLVPLGSSFKMLDMVAGLETNSRDQPADTSKATILEAKIIDYSSPGLGEPDRDTSIISEVKVAGGFTDHYYSPLHEVAFDVPYRWAVDEGPGPGLQIVMEPTEMEHNVQIQIDATGFTPQVLVLSEKRDPSRESAGVPTSFFSISSGDDPKILSNYIFVNDLDQKAHLMVTTQKIQTDTDPIKFRILQLHFVNLENAYSIVYVNVEDWFRYEVGAFHQVVENFEIMIDGKMQSILFQKDPIYKQIISDVKEKPEPEPLPPARIGGCLIATAAYGSELAPQVQHLRELRDNVVLQTESGSAFMSGFNQFYYSFSPIVADYERENPAFKEAVKLTITPLLASLTLLQYADINSESEMFGYGIGVILLNIGMYFVAPAVLIMKIRSFYKLQ
jgi:peptidyl-prolyl cis-trans isomerase B (cyclophilin B)